MPETRKVRRPATLTQLQKLYANRPVGVATGPTTKDQPVSNQGGLINPVTKRQVVRDVTKTIMIVALFLALFVGLYLTQNTGPVQNAINWVGTHTGF